jgi:hypothetical protein
LDEHSNSAPRRSYLVQNGQTPSSGARLLVGISSRAPSRNYTYMLRQLATRSFATLAFTVISQPSYTTCSIVYNCKRNKTPLSRELPAALQGNRSSHDYERKAWVNNQHGAKNTSILYVTAIQKYTEQPKVEPSLLRTVNLLIPVHMIHSIQAFVHW